MTTPSPGEIDGLLQRLQLAIEGSIRDLKSRAQRSLGDDDFASARRYLDHTEKLDELARQAANLADGWAPLASAFDQALGGESGPSPTDQPTGPHRGGSLSSEASQFGPRRVRREFKGVTAAGWFDPSTGELRLDEGPLAGRSFPTPTAAAVELVKAADPERHHPETNGWRFWIVDETGRPLDSLRRGR